ncbi:polymer-forming cytoskeletal protein [Cohnella suwonensis]|uniref:Polymer-forming cytoskeletal protein n=1 Tax=Cohnella suwonensis TaxID=696072 RepID=A0ABW0LVT1_9BACL
METSTMKGMKPNLVINGVSSAGGGDYGSVKIDGVGTVEGDISAESINANGMTKIRGSIRTDDLDFDGMGRIDGDVIAKKSAIDGYLTVKGSIRAEQFVINGVLNVAGECEFESLEATGAFDLKGFVNAGQMNVLLQGKGKATDIGVESITVRKIHRSAWSKLWTWAIPKFIPELQAKSIEGDNIHLENTEADVVRGNRVFIGKGCRIGLVEYRTELQKHPDAKIGKEAKTGE